MLGEIPHCAVNELAVLSCTTAARIAKRVSGNPGAQHNARCRSVRPMLSISAILEMLLGAVQKANTLRKLKDFQTFLKDGPS